MNNEETIKMQDLIANSQHDDGNLSTRQCVVHRRMHNEKDQN